MAKIPSETRRVQYSESESLHIYMCTYTYIQNAHMSNTQLHSDNCVPVCPHCPVHTTHACMCTQNRYVCVLHNHICTPHMHNRTPTFYHTYSCAYIQNNALLKMHTFMHILPLCTIPAQINENNTHKHVGNTSCTSATYVCTLYCSFPHGLSCLSYVLCLCLLMTRDSEKGQLLLVLE